MQWEIGIREREIEGISIKVLNLSWKILIILSKTNWQGIGISQWIRRGRLILDWGNILVKKLRIQKKKIWNLSNLEQNSKSILWIKLTISKKGIERLILWIWTRIRKISTWFVRYLSLCSRDSIKRINSVNSVK